MQVALIILLATIAPMVSMVPKGTKRRNLDAKRAGLLKSIDSLLSSMKSDTKDNFRKPPEMISKSIKSKNGGFKSASSSALTNPLETADIPISNSDATNRLFGISDVITPDLLKILADMGHGDTIAIVDHNFPAYTVSNSAEVPLIRLPGISISQVLEEILKLIPMNDPEPVKCQDVLALPTPTPDGLFTSLDTLAQILNKHHVNFSECEPMTERNFRKELLNVSGIVQTSDLNRQATIIVAKGELNLDSDTTSEKASQTKSDQQLIYQDIKKQSNGTEEAAKGTDGVESWIEL